MNKYFMLMSMIVVLSACGKGQEHMTPTPEVQKGVEAEKQSLTKPRMAAPQPLTKADFDKAGAKK